MIVAVRGASIVDLTSIDCEATSFLPRRQAILEMSRRCPLMRTHRRPIAKYTALLHP
jgi:hypothetical protein